MKNEIEVPLYVIQGLEEVRTTGKYNMFEMQNVFNELYHLGHYEAVNWLYNEKYEEGSYSINKQQVNLKKYTAALNELSNCRSLINKFL